MRVLDKNQIEKKIHRLALQVYEGFLDEKELIIAGINGNGFELARLLHKAIQDHTKLHAELVEIKLDKANPKAASTSVNLASEKIQGKPVLIVDDVLNTGKTMVYAISVFIREGSSLIRTAVLADRNHKRFPVSADYVGISMATTLQEHLNFSIKGKQMELILE